MKRMILAAAILALAGCTTPIAIRSTQIRDRVRQMATEKDARLLKQAPKEMRGTIGLELIDDE